MRRVVILALFCFALLDVGCKRYNASDFPLKAGMSAEDLADKMGSPSRAAAHWVGYTLKDGTELRAYFLEGPRNGKRTLSEADVYTDKGVFIRQIFKLPTPPPASQPATRPASQP